MNATPGSSKNVLYLLNKDNRIDAKLIPGKEITILNDWLYQQIKNTGITVSREFKEKHQTGWRVYPNDKNEIFAKAFKQFCFTHGLQQIGYSWKTSDQLMLNDKLADYQLES